MNSLVHVSLLVVLIGLVVGFPFLIWILLISYKLERSCLSVRLFHLIPIKRFRFSNIAEARIVAFGKLLPWRSPLAVFRLGNRIASQAVLITQKRGMVRYFVITPANPEAFLFELRSRIAGEASHTQHTHDNEDQGLDRSTAEFTTHSVQKRILIAITAALLTFVLVAVLFGQFNWFRFRTLARGGIRVEGEVTKLEPQNHLSVSYSYQVGGTAFLGVGKSGYGNPDFHSLKVGDKVHVYYDPRNPAKSILGEPEYRLKNESVSVLLAATVCSLVVLIVAYRALPKRSPTR